MPAEAVNVRILDRDYRVGCPREERDDLVRAAEHLDSEMRRLRDGGNVVGSDRLAVIAALNAVNEMLRLRAANSEFGSEYVKRVEKLQQRVAAALDD